MTNFKCKYAKYSYSGNPNTVYYLKDVYQLDQGFTATQWTFITTSGRPHSFPSGGGLFDFVGMHMFQPIKRLPAKVKKVLG